MLTVGICVRAAVLTAFAAALFGVRTAYAGVATLFGSAQVENSTCHDGQHDKNNDVVFQRASPFHQH